MSDSAEHKPYTYKNDNAATNTSLKRAGTVRERKGRRVTEISVERPVRKNENTVKIAKKTLSLKYLNLDILWGYRKSQKSKDSSKRADAFSRGYLILAEVLNAASHGVAFGLSIAALAVLIVSAVSTQEPVRIVSYSIYGSTMVLLYLFSTLYHSLSFTGAKKVMRILDHSSIYIFIAGTYTPYCLVTVGGTFGWTMFGIIWGLAVAGIIFKSVFIGRKSTLSTVVYILMGWFCIVAVKPLYAGLGKNGFMLLLSGGIAFTAGAIFYSMKRVKFTHLIWHIFVMLGTGLMYFSILLYA